MPSHGILVSSHSIQDTSPLQGLHSAPSCLPSCVSGQWPRGSLESSCLGLSVHWLHSPAPLAPHTPAASLCLSFCTCCMSCLGHLPCHPHQPFQEESVLITFLLVVTNYPTKTTAERKSLFCRTVPEYNPSWWGSYRKGAGGCWSHCVQFRDTRESYRMGAGGC